MKIKNLIVSTCILLIYSCSNDTENTMESVLWIDSERVNCSGVGEQTCYRIQKNEVINNENWMLFYDGIEGFDAQYETGYVYKIRVSKTEIKNPPADGSAMAYKLKKIISKELVE